jgi:uncharacterized coiled-coil protein SlyX
MTLRNVIDARPGTPIPTYELEKLITQPDPREAKLSDLEAKLAAIEAQLKELQKIAAATDKIYQLEAQLKGIQAMVMALYEKLNSTPPTPQPTPPTEANPANQTDGTKVAEQTPEPPPTDPREMLKKLMPTEEEIERMILRLLYKKVAYWHGRANLKVDENGYAVIGRDVNFGIKYSRLVAVITKYGLADWVIVRGNDSAGYYVEIKASDMGTVLRHLKTLDEAFKGALSRP